MRRTAIHLDDVARREHLGWAFWRAAQGKRHKPEVQRFAEHLDRNLDRLRVEILDGCVSVGHYHRFEIRDPKPRTIHAPVFRERVLHHALMAHLEPVFERYLIDDTFACRVGKGSWAAVLRAQEHCRKWPWYLKFDIRHYFLSIAHVVLKRAIRKRVKGARVLDLVDRLIDSYEVSPGRGLPIGALTSQHFANLYLASLDRYLIEELGVGGIVRYMDDTVVWSRDRSTLKCVFEASQHFANHRLNLEIKPTWLLQRSSRGLPLCGYRIDPGQLRLSGRRRRRYRKARERWERAYLEGRIDEVALQAGYASALAITWGADSTAWRRRELVTRPAFEV